MFPKGFIKPTTSRTDKNVCYVSPSEQTNVGLYMSTFYPRRITIKGITYPTMEHAYQAAKFRLTDHPIIARKFRHGGSITCPKAAREFGSREGLEDIGVNLDREKWRQVKHDVFNHIVLKRAEQDSFFKQLLHP